MATTTSKMASKKPTTEGKIPLQILIL